MHRAFHLTLTHFDRSIILETDPQLLSQRVSMRDATAEVPITEKTASEVVGGLKEKLFNQFLKGTS